LMFGICERFLLRLEIGTSESPSRLVWFFLFRLNCISGVSQWLRLRK
jgi:hypothetical protein